MDLIRFREAVNKEMRARGLNQSRLADLLVGYPGFPNWAAAQKWLSKYLLGGANPPAPPLLSVCTVLGISLQDIGLPAPPMGVDGMSRGKGRGGERGEEGLMVQRGDNWVRFRWGDCAEYAKEGRLRMMTEEGAAWVRVVRRAGHWTLEHLGPAEEEDGEEVAT